MIPACVNEEDAEFGHDGGYLCDQTTPPESPFPFFKYK